MGYVLKDYEQVETYTAGDSTVHIRSAPLLCDTVSDLPTPTGISGYTLEAGSVAWIISDAVRYMMDTSGTWQLQRTSDLSSIISQLSQIEDDLQDTTADATWAKTQIDDFIYPALISLIDRGAKNALDLSTAQTVTDNGVTFTVNTDSSITITGSATPPNNGWFVLGVTIPDGVYIFSGMPESGGTSSYRQEIRATPRGSVIGVNDAAAGNQITISAGGATVYYHIRAASGYDFGAGVTVKPMLSQPNQYKISDAYVPYSPTNRELLDLIRSYHP